jgi:cytoskeletal protein RodZ
MDGFNVISVDKDSSKNSAQNIPTDFGIEIIDQDKEKEKKEQNAKTGGLVLFLSFLVLVAVLGYQVFLIIYRLTSVNEIIANTEEMSGIAKSIDLKEIQEFRSMDNTLKTINSKLNKHILTSEVVSVINQNIRKTIQISEYRLDVKQADVEVSLTGIAPSFRELAEQTEKLFQIKDQGKISNFTVTSISFESETKRVKFSIRIIFDKSKMNAVALSQNNI